MWRIQRHYSGEPTADFSEILWFPNLAALAGRDA